MSWNEFGYPNPATFDDEPARRERTARKAPWGMLFLILFLGGLGAIAIQFGDSFRPAMNQFRRMAQAQSKNRRANMLYIRIQQNLRRGDYAAALEDSSKLIEHEPVMGRILRGDVYGRMKKYTEAVADYDEAIKRDPTQAVAYNNRAYNKALARVDLDAAMADVEKAIAIAGNIPAYIDTRGYIHYLKGRFKPALADFNFAIGRSGGGDDDEGMGELYFHRGLVHKELGEKELAEQDFNQAKELGYAFDEFPRPVSNEK